MFSVPATMDEVTCEVRRVENTRCSIHLSSRRCRTDNDWALSHDLITQREAAYLNAHDVCAIVDVEVGRIVEFCLDG